MSAHYLQTFNSQISNFPQRPTPNDQRPPISFLPSPSSLLPNKPKRQLAFPPKTRLRLRSATLAWPKTKDLPSPSSYLLPPSSYLNALMVNHSVLPTYKLSIFNYQFSNFKLPKDQRPPTPSFSALLLFNYPLRT